MDSSLLATQGLVGLRCVRIPRWKNGFGFTLRHFIVYPPELYSEDGEADGRGHANGVGQSRLHKVTEPVDTIFVKSVRENSPAASAGLCVGDRIVSVNGETIVGKSYDQVVSLIQQTRDLLCLEVSPKQYDTLQLFYEEQAYRPETNQRPYEALKSSSSSEPLYHYPSAGDFHRGSNSQLPNDYAYRSYDEPDYPRFTANMSSSHSSHPQFFSHLPRPVPYKSSAVWASTSADRNGDRNYPSSLSQSSNAVQRQQPQTYYPFNHSFDKSTVWKVRERDEPNSGAKSADSILGENIDTAIYRSPLRSESMECLSELNTAEMALKKAGPGYRYSISTAKTPGAGASQPSDFRNTMVVTMSSTNAGQTPRHPRDSYMYPGPDHGTMIPPGASNSFSGYENQIVDRIRRTVEQKEEFLKRPNQPFWGPFTPQQAPPPFPKELYAQPQKFSKVPWPPENVVPSVTSTKQPLQSSVVDNRNLTGRGDKKAKSNNVTVISVQHSGPDSLSSGSSCRPETSNSDSWSPVDRNSESDNAIDVQKLCIEKEISRKEAYSPSNLLSMYELPKNRTTVVGSRKLHCDPPPDWKPDLATLTGYQDPPQTCVSPRVDEVNRDACFPTGSFETDAAEVKISSDNVILRRKELEPESESERLVRRVSYLKATSSPIDMERKSTSPTSPVKSFDVMSCKPPYTSGATTGRRRSMANRLATEFFPKGRIHKLKQFFEDRTQPTSSLFKFYVDSPTSEYPGLGIPKADKFVDVTEVVRDGKVHFKIRIGENKRGTYNRSWRQGFAQVRRSGYLYLSKERLQRDAAVTGNEESVIISVSIKDGVQIEPAEDYTKRKYVIRVRTSFVPDDESNFPLSLITDSYQPPQSLNPVPQLTVELLIQTEDQSDLIFWVNCLQKQLENNNCNTDTSVTSNLHKGIFFGSEFCPKSKSFLTSLLPSPGTPVQNLTIQEKAPSAPSASGPSSSNTLNPNVGVSISNSAASPKVKTWKGKVAKQWKKVHDIIDTGSSSSDTKITSPYASLPPAGATFGINLEDCPPGETNPFIPRVIEYSIALIERKGIEMVGLYRIPGNNASVQILTERLNRGEDPNPERDPRWLDVHVVASLIKSFLRRLPDPLLTNDRYPAFIQAADEDEKTSLAKIKELINTLPVHYYETLKAVVMHLKHVAEKGEANRMDARNLAIVFGPTIVRTAGESINSMVVDMKNQCKIVEALVLNAEEVFSVEPTGARLVPIPILRQISEEQQKSDIIISVNDSIKLEEIQKQLPPSPPTIENELKTSLIKAAKRKISAKENHSLSDEPKLQLQEYKPVDEKGFIRTYAGLNEVTERRIRNFELETKAMLYRDDRSPNSSVLNVGSNKPIKGIEDIRQQQMKLDDALKKAKDDLEQDDIYDQIADNPSSIVHHRDRGIFASSPGPFNLSNSSLSSSNSNSTAPSSLLTSSLPAWPTGSRLGPVPFRNSMPPQSLPPKPPVVAINSSSLNSSFDAVPSNAQSQASMRRVNSFDRLQGPQSTAGAVNDATAKFDKMSITTKDSFRRLRRSDGTFVPGVSNPKQLGGSLDSLKDLTAENIILGNTRMRSVRVGGNEGSREDLSPKSSDGSDMVTTLTKTLDKKLRSLRTQFSGAEANSSITSEDTHSSEITLKDCSTVDPQTNGTEEYNNHNKNQASVTNHKPATLRLTSVDTSTLANQNSFLKKGRRRHSLIERRKSSVDMPSKDSSLLDNANDLSNDSEKSDGSKSTKSNSKKVSKECRRRHSLSGATDILSLVFRGSEKLSVHKDLDSKKNKTLSSEALLSALKNASILESHV